VWIDEDSTNGRARGAAVAATPLAAAAAVPMPTHCVSEWWFVLMPGAYHNGG